MAELLDDIKHAVAALKRGEVILYPTDTVWGIGCDASNSHAVKRIFEIKHRTDSKALIALVGSPEQLHKTVENLPEEALHIIENTPRPVTVVYDHGVGVAPEMLASDGSLAVRVTNEDFSKKLCLAFGGAIVSTSANVSGKPTARSFDEISPEIINAVDYVCLSGRDCTGPSSPSMVVKVSDTGTVHILRN